MPVISLNRLKAPKVALHQRGIFFMAKRFFDTSRIEEDWYINLSLKHRELLRYCESKCDGAGVFSFNSKVASTYIGEKVSEPDLIHLGIEKLPNGKYFITGFCFFQNGNLSEKSPAHKPIFNSIKQNEITEDRLSNTLYNTLSDRDLDIEREKVIVKEKEKEKESDFEIEKSELEKAFDSWVEMRKKMKGGISVHAIQLGKSELKKLSGGSEQTAIEIINQSILNSWKGFFPLNKQNGTKNNGQPNIDKAMELADKVLRGEISGNVFGSY